MHAVRFNDKMSIMNRHNSSKINHLIKAWPRGTVALQSWLTKQGVYRQLADSYRQTAWLERIGPGAFKLAGDRVDWTGGVYALQQQLHLPVHIAGKTALEMQGYAHFLPLGKRASVWVFGALGTKLPAWFKKYDWGHQVRYVTVDLFGKEKGLGLALVAKDMDSYSVTIAAAERAILELLHLVPHDSSFDGALHLMEGLTTLRPELVQTLLERCWSVKVKRLFLFMAEKCNHPWVPKLNLSKIKLGRGKRLVVKGGQFNPKYQITVPA